MKHPRAKLIVGVLLLVAAVAALGTAYFHFGLYADAARFDRDLVSKTETIRDMYDTVISSRIGAEDFFSQRKLANVKGIASVLRPIVRKYGDDALRAYDNGFIVRLDGDFIVWPEGMDAVPEITVEELKDWDGEILEEGFIIRDTDSDSYFDMYLFQRVAGNYFYVDDASGVLNEYSDTNEHIIDIIHKAEKAMNCEILTFQHIGDDDWVLLFPSERFEGRDTPEEIGVDISAQPGAVQTFNVGGEAFRYAVSEPITESGYGIELRAVVLTPSMSWSKSRRTGVAVVLAVALLPMAALTTWVIAAEGLLRRRRATAAESARYAPARARVVALGIGVLGLILVVCTTMFLHSMIGMVNAYENSISTLDGIAESQDRDKQWVGDQKDRQSGLYVGYVQRVADVLYSTPELATPETLDVLSDNIDANYLMYFNNKGEEVMTNSKYINISFGTEPGSSTYDFRRLLSGMPSVVHDACEDEQTGLYSRLIGVSVGDGREPDGYGALIMSMPPEAGSYNESTNAVLDAHTSNNNLCFAVNPESGTITYSSDGSLVGMNARSLGLNDMHFQDGVLDFFTFNGKKWYGLTREINGLIYLLFTKEDAILTSFDLQGAVFGGLFLAVYALLALALLWDYRKNMKHCAAPAADAAEDEPEVSHGGDYFGEHESVGAWWQSKSPGWKALFVVEVLLGLEMLGCLLAIQFRFDIDDSSYMISYLFSGQVRAGFNMFALTKIALLALGVILVVMTLKLLTGLALGMLDTRGKTICLFAFNLVQYVVIAMAIYFAFKFVNVDISIALTSIAAVSFAITLLANDVIKDVLAGISTAFSNSYRIGDYVEVGGFRGRVQDITMSSTTLVNNDGNIKVVNNRDVRNVLNMSRGRTRYTIDIHVGYDQPIDEIEKIMRTELPKIGKRIPEILDEPRFLGITAFGGGGVTLTIAAGCQETDYSVVRHKLNNELHRLFHEKHIVLK